MSGFDTSGRVRRGVITPRGSFSFRPGFIRWTDLNPFTQGYVEAMAISSRHQDAEVFAFHQLAPETLARIMEDCAAFQASRAYEPMRGLAGPAWAQSHHYAGQTFWIARNNGETDFTFTLRTGRGQDWPDFSAEPMNRLAKSFPPLTPYLGDDGKVYLRDAPSPSSDRGGS